MEEICRQELPPFKKKQLQHHGDMCQLSPILLISSQEELNPQLFQHPPWWKGPKWLIQEPSSWPTTEVNTPTEHLEMGNVHVALRQPPEDFTQRFSRLSKLIRFVAYCRRFINNCRHSKAKQTTTLSTQELDQALACFVKMVQQISYTQGMKDLMDFNPAKLSEQLFILLCALPEGYSCTSRIFTTPK